MFLMFLQGLPRLVRKNLNIIKHALYARQPPGSDPPPSLTPPALREFTGRRCSSSPVSRACLTPDLGAVRSEG